MVLFYRGRGPGLGDSINFKAEDHFARGVSDRKSRSSTAAMISSLTEFPPQSPLRNHQTKRPHAGYDMGPRRHAFGKFSRNYSSRIPKKYNGISAPELDLTKPWVTDAIKIEERKKQEALEKWKMMSSTESWTVYQEQKSIVQKLYDLAKADYSASHPNEALLLERNPSLKSYFCETCDKAFKTEDNLFLHEAEHETCGREGCQFTAHPKIIAKHIKMQHESGLYKRIGRLYTEEEINKWVEERKKRYPTRRVIEEKKILEKEKINRGERIKDSSAKFNKSFIKKGRTNEKKIKKNIKKKRVKKKKESSVIEKILEEETSTMRKGVPAFSGIKTVSEPIQPENEDLNISDDEWETESKPSVVKLVLNNSLGLLAACYDSEEENQNEPFKENKMGNLSADESSGPEEVSSKNPLPEDSKKNYILPKRKFSGKREKPEKKRRNLACDYNFATNSSTLLEKLLKNEIRHERNIDNARNFRQGEMLAAFWSYRHSHANSKRLKVPNVESVVNRVLDSPYNEIVIYHLKCLNALDDKNILEAFQNQYELVQTFVKLFQSQKEENWMLKVMQIICLELRLLASPADKQANNKKHPHECLEKTAEALMACFRICAADNRSSEQDTKKWGMLTLVNQMFKVYFKINRHQLCKPLMRAIDSSNLKDRFALAQLITYKFFAGQRAMFDGDFKTANECLSFAFLRCHKNSPKNKRSVLLYLVPVKMILGYMPKKSLLEKYNLLEFWDVVEAVKMGNIQKFNEVMEHFREFFVKHNIYIIMQRLSTIAIRNLIKKVWLNDQDFYERGIMKLPLKWQQIVQNCAYLTWIGQTKTYHIVNSHQIPVEMFLKALLAMKIEDASWDEAECLLANLILEGKVKGYISYQHDTLVVSKLTPFPVISTLK